MIRILNLIWSTNYFNSGFQITSGVSFVSHILLCKNVVEFVKDSFSAIHRYETGAMSAVQCVGMRSCDSCLPWVFSRYTVVRDTLFLTANAYWFLFSRTHAHTEHVCLHQLDGRSDKIKTRVSVNRKDAVYSTPVGSVVLYLLIQTHLNITARKRLPTPCVSSASV